MFSIANLLDSAKAKANIETDYRLGKALGINHQVISGYRLGKSLPNELIIGQLCALSGDDPDVIAAQIQAARSKTPEAKNLWLRVAARMAGGATTAILSVCFAIALIAGYAPTAGAGEVWGIKNPVTQQSIHRINCVYVRATAFILVRLRRCAGVLRLCFAASLA